MNRIDKRLAKKAIGKRILNHPAAKRMERNIKRYGQAATEVYRLDGATADANLYFDVFSMRQWAATHCQIVPLAYDWDRAARLLENEAVNFDRIRDHTVKNALHPVIIGRDAAGSGEDQMLDGAHRYIAAGAAAVAIGMEGQVFPIPAYILQSDQWRQFLIPLDIAQAFHFDAHY